MKKYVSALLVFLISFACLADESAPQTPFTGTANWSNFDQYMQEADAQDRQVGWSYLASGLLVTLGGTLGGQSTSDSATRVVYGLAATVGVVASAYGLERIYNGNNFTSFYDSLKNSQLTDEQRDQLVSHFIQEEKEKEVRRRRISMITNIVMAGLNLYSASQETDKDTRNFFYAFAGINAALALSYSF